MRSAVRVSHAVAAGGSRAVDRGVAGRRASGRLAVVARLCRAPRGAARPSRRAAARTRSRRQRGRAGRAVFIDPGAYLHRYGAMDAQARDDLVAKVPAGARARLSTSDARGGGTARRLAAGGRGARRSAIEPDAADAAQAARVYDRVLARRRSKRCGEEFPGRVRRGPLRRRPRASARPVGRARRACAPGFAPAASSSRRCRTSGTGPSSPTFSRGGSTTFPTRSCPGTHVRFFTRRTLDGSLRGLRLRGRADRHRDASRFPRRGREARAAPRASRARRQDLDAAEFLAVARPEDRGRRTAGRFPSVIIACDDQQGRRVGGRGGRATSSTGRRSSSEASGSAGSPRT